MSWKNDQVSEPETAKIIELAREALKVEGDFVELGCYRGDTSLILADLLRGTDKELWLYDSFEGLPEKSEADASVVGENFKGGELVVTKREVKARFLRAGLPLPVIKKAWFADLTDDDLPNKIAFAFLDGDFYESIKDSLKLVESKMAKGGTMIVHDYNNIELPGVVKAVDEWLRGKSLAFATFDSMAVIKF